jgi:hypothetical protein
MAMTQEVSDKANEAKGQEEASLHDLHGCWGGCGDDDYLYSLCVFMIMLVYTFVFL